MSLKSWIHALTAPNTISKLDFKTSKEIKLVLLVNHELKMGKGKIAAQVGHASVKAALNASARHPDLMQGWLNNGQPKVVLKVQKTAELEQIIELAKENNLEINTIRDAGKTQIPPNSLTVVAIGPDFSEKINVVSKDLKLL
ncbi:MAG: aminoacyl-tRNA hydrolase [Euryarchaeota archaeon]|mgnify:CR=1 FL=1|nr:aminoacyl-tRNA hydrolase [Euryarchaeota archaeon]|tara:strand:+ start:885 stop:1310 length:426 start_codon:yes stop_codon:yes gene_type:complete